MEGELRERLRELGVADRAELLGYLPIHGGLMDRYRSVNAFLHVSWTEGMPQVLLEAFAAGTPVVATAVGGVPEAAGDAALLIPPGRSRRGRAAALGRIAADPELRRELVAKGIERVRGRTLEAESARVARFLADPDGSVQNRLIRASGHRFAESSRSAGRAGDPSVGANRLLCQATRCSQARARQLTP